MWVDVQKVPCAFLRSFFGLLMFLKTACNGLVPLYFKPKELYIFAVLCYHWPFSEWNPSVVFFLMFYKSHNMHACVFVCVYVILAFLAHHKCSWQWQQFASYIPNYTTNEDLLWKSSFLADFLQSSLEHLLDFLTMTILLQTQANAQN